MNRLALETVMSFIALSPLWLSVQAFALSSQAVPGSGLSSLHLRQLISQTAIEVSEKITPEWITVSGNNSDYPDAINQATLIQDDDKVVFEAFFSFAFHYGQIEGDCSTEQYRFLLVGRVEESGEITSVEEGDLEWQMPSQDPDKDNILSFVCSL